MEKFHVWKMYGYVRGKCMGYVTHACRKHMGHMFCTCGQHVEIP